MKKTVSVLLAAAMMFSLAACTSNNNNTDKSGRDGETAGPSKPAWGSETSEFTEPTETETEETTTTTTTEATTSETTTAASNYGVVTDYVFDMVDDYKEYGDRYIAYLSPDGVITVVLVENGEWDDDKYHIWNIDCVTGEEVDNKKLADLAGITDITQTAKDACQAYINSRGGMTVKDYELVYPDNEYYASAVEDTFSEDRINDDMKMGVTGDGTVFFISGVASLGGADWYYEMYDVTGQNMNKADGWIR